MIKRFGEAKVEAIVRGWVANNPTLISDTAFSSPLPPVSVMLATRTLLPGTLAGERSRLPSGALLGQSTNDRDARQHLWGWSHSHAKHRANAIKLIEFLSRPEAQQLLVNSNFEYPANPQTPVHPILAKWGRSSKTT